MLPDGKFFEVEEFRCRSGECYPIQYEYPWESLIALCDAVRDEWGSPLVVVSGYRTPKYNAELIKADAAKGVHGIASGSQHTFGRAADLRPTTGTVEDLHLQILHLHELGGLPMLGGLGIYPESKWCHVDTYLLPDKHLRLWTGM